MEDEMEELLMGGNPGLTKKKAVVMETMAFAYV